MPTLTEIFSGFLVYTIMFGVALGQLLALLVRWVLTKVTKCVIIRTMNKDKSFPITEVMLEPIRYAVAVTISEHALANIKTTVDWEYDLHSLVVKLEKEVYSERLADETVQWPATWWDAFKARWFSIGLRRKYPVNYSHADFTIYRGYPDLVLPEKKSVLFAMKKYT